MKHHSLRRTREKLRTLMETPHLSWILGDMIDLVWEDLFGEEGQPSDRYKVQFIERLKNRYQELIKEQERIPPKQSRLDI